MPDATHGVPVWRIKWRNPQEQSFHHYLDQQRSANVIGSEPGTWYPADVAAALEGVIEAARWLDAQLSPESRAGLHAALAHLDAIRGVA